MERIPILQMGDLLLVTIQVDMHDRLAMTLQDDLTTRISQVDARGVLIDISALEIVDSFIGRVLGNIAKMAQVLDAETVVVGMQPAVAITLVELGLSLTGIRTALNVEKGMALLRAAVHQDLNGDERPVLPEEPTGIYGEM
ncbi:STAS domain-containing protein [Trichocoleus sp. FACHB-591]|uniref:STAS domain-containing protein n=1 Tax=Trichocoleus sp. FACHB-591 TaxID=2692872 RepID=UPI00168426D1|nr:STAS domain-containing protein [Trichocoleus sp. FACHB-591]MBD2093982.1 STAS domain-containing protein [Trichocoleus sp. FACHB-591]